MIADKVQMAATVEWLELILTNWHCHLMQFSCLTVIVKGFIDGLDILFYIGKYNMVLYCRVRIK